MAKGYGKDIAVGSLSEHWRSCASAISGGAIGKGTAIMTGVGAAGGLANLIYDKG